MKQLRFTTSKPRCFGLVGVPLTYPNDKDKLMTSKTLKSDRVYIHGMAEEKAGYDIPIFIDGNMAQLDLPVDEQNIIMMLPIRIYKCKAYLSEGFGVGKKYLIVLKEEVPVNHKNYNFERLKEYLSGINLKERVDITEEFLGILNEVQFNDLLDLFGIKFSVKRNKYYRYFESNSEFLLPHEKVNILEAELKKVCDIMGVKVSDVKTKSRKTILVSTRYIYYAEAKRKYKSFSLSTIGDILIKNHATVLYGLDQVHEESYLHMKAYDKYKRKLSEIKKAVP